MVPSLSVHSSYLPPLLSAASRVPGEAPGLVRATQTRDQNRRAFLWRTWCSEPGSASPFSQRYCLREGGSPRPALAGCVRACARPRRPRCSRSSRVETVWLCVLFVPCPRLCLLLRADPCVSNMFLLPSARAGAAGTSAWSVEEHGSLGAPGPVVRAPWTTWALASRLKLGSCHSLVQPRLLASPRLPPPTCGTGSSVLHDVSAGRCVQGC